MTTSDASLDLALHAIADPTRRRSVQSWKAGAKNADKAGEKNSLCGGEIEERIRLSQPTISHRMAILVKADLVEATKRGQWRWYRRNEKVIRQILKTLRGKL